MGRVRSLYRKIGWAERLFLLFLVVFIPVFWMAPDSSIRYLLEFGLIVTGLVAGVRYATRAIRRAIWRLRNRLVVAYVLIAVVPFGLILLLAGIGAYVLTGQIAVYLVTSQLERRSEALLAPIDGLVGTSPQDLPDRIRWLAPYFRQRYPGLELAVRHGHEWRYPEDASIQLPPSIEEPMSGLVLRDKRYFLWAQGARDAAEAALRVPLTGDLLGSLVPELGEVTVGNFLLTPDSSGKAVTSTEIPVGARPHGGRVPLAANRFDVEVTSFALVPVFAGNQSGQLVALYVTTRPSAVLSVFFSRRLDFLQGVWGTVLLGTTVFFLLFVILALWIGVTMTRTITGAVHGLYEGTRFVMEGDFSHRVAVKGIDQLADLGRSFNRMTENLERLLRVEKEKERLQSEIEIAREVQNQLYPKTAPIVPGLELLAFCRPARMVSGDYFDYLSLHGAKFALAVGDVAGKGISAALLMATVQSSLRTQIRYCLDSAAQGSMDGFPSAAQLVSQLNQQLYAFTSAEKFATFYFGIYDADTGLLTYTNAGHPPPMLIRGGETIRLETNGMVVGAFPFAEYGESHIPLLPGDLLVCFTDGITEPENEYGEMFGEDRLEELLLKHSWRKPSEIIETVLEAVGQWTALPDAADDMTLLVARRQ